MAMLMKTKQILQISTFLSAYPKDVVELGVEAWRTGERKLRKMLKYTRLLQKSLSVIAAFRKRESSML